MADPSKTLINPLTGLPVITAEEKQANAEFLQARKEREEALEGLPEGVPEGYLSSKQLGLLINPEIKEANAAGNNILSNLRTQHAESNIATYRGVAVPSEAIVPYLYNNNIAYAIRQREGQKIAAICMQEKTQPEGYRSGNELGEAIQKVKPMLTSRTGQGVIKNIRKQHEKGRTATYKGVSVSTDAIAGYEYKGKPAYAIRQQEFDQIVAAYADEKGVPDGYRTAEELEEAVIKMQPAFKAGGHTIVGSIREQHEKVGSATYKGVPVSADAIAEYTYKGKPAYAIRQQEFDQIVTACAAEKGVPVGYRTALELGQAIQAVQPEFKQDDDSARKRGHAIISDIRRQHQQAKHVTYEGIHIPTDAIGSYTSHGRPAFALRQQEFDAVVATYIAKTGVPVGYKTGLELTEAIQKVCPDIQAAIGPSITSRVRKKLETNHSITYKGVQFVSDSFARYQSTQGQVSYAIRGQEFDAIVAAYAAEQQQEAAADQSAEVPPPDEAVTGPKLAPHARKRKR